MRQLNKICEKIVSLVSVDHGRLCVKKDGAY